jgi:dTDP-4-amino-4,6-dideoxygalactose transaminase
MSTSARKIPFVKPYLPAVEEIWDDVREILASGYLTKGRHLQAFEGMAREELHAPHALGVSSCTTALMLLMMDLGRDGGEVILPSFSFVATALPIIWGNLEPAFVDCAADTLNAVPELVEEAITPRTKAVLVTHVFGNPADVDALEDVAGRHGIRLFFDAAHAFGSTYKGRAAGACGDGSAFSCTPTKLVITGEGGVVTTKHADLARMVEVAREYGNPGTYDNTLIGLNGRLPELSALLGVRTLAMLPSMSRAGARSRHGTAERSANASLEYASRRSSRRRRVHSRTSPFWWTSRSAASPETRWHNS